ncbi:hypothetical protein [Umboniibacter marinipuniceus]|uniref:Uncharacterized protein n=1 Tax=Umboniibacter marinipuniceus TaxID=569599 RepID=A0A3M0A0Q9_9GAMM|nr:hypothetical protein [Umboniibacter marinipuniceus]RMA78711.1 hypothetical protein DFR27_2042 [Umboniibacter marinipuniceus]
MNPSYNPDKPDPNVTGIFSRQAINEEPAQRIRCVSPEFTGIKMIYQCDEDTRYYALPILCWSMLEDGRVTGLVAWQDSVCPCDQVTLAYGGRWVGYQDCHSNALQLEAPESKRVELLAMAQQPTKTHQRLFPEIIGTHALILADNDGGYDLRPIVGWRLIDGAVIGLFHANYEQRSKPLAEQQTFSANQPEARFLYYFHYAIAKRVHAKEPGAMASMKDIVMRLIG